MIEARTLECKPAVRKHYKGTPLIEVCYFESRWASPRSIVKKRQYLRIRQAARGHVATAHPDEMRDELILQKLKRGYKANDKLTYGRIHGSARAAVAKRHPDEMLFWIEVERANLDEHEPDPECGCAK